MRVTIKGRTVEYRSDFDPVRIYENVSRNWKVSAGDYFKFPVTIEGVSCFVKRFSRKKHDISGFGFLDTIKGGKRPGLPEVYDLVSETENGNEVLYLFLEYLEGDTLENHQRKGFSFAPLKLAGDLHAGLLSIHAQGYWFPDFDPKNLFRTDKGDFYIIDLDSAYPLSVLPVPSVFGSKDYWMPVYNYYRERSGFSGEEIKTLRGDVLNTLHLLYFLALYACYLSGDGEDLTSLSLQKLNTWLSGRCPMFNSILLYCFHRNVQTGQPDMRPMPMTVLASFTQTCLFKEEKEQFISTSARQAPGFKPRVQLTLKGGKRTLVKGQPYELLWQTVNAETVYLDGLKKDKQGSGIFTAQNAVTHTLKAVHSKNGNTEVSIPIQVEEAPVISLSVFPGQITSGGEVMLHWEVTLAAKVNILRDGVILFADCEPKGNRSMQLSRGSFSQKTILFDVEAIGSAGGSHRLETPVPVVVKKKDYTWVILIALLLVLIIVIFLAQRNRSTYSGDPGPTDTTVAVTTPAAGTDSIAAPATSQHFNVDSAVKKIEEMEAEPSIEKIKQDLVGHSIPGWAFASADEIVSAETVETDTGVNRRYYTMKLGLSASGVDKPWEANVIVIYERENEGLLHHWIFQDVKMEKIVCYYDIDPDRWRTIEPPGPCNYAIVTENNQRFWVKENGSDIVYRGGGDDEESYHLTAGSILLESRESVSIMVSLVCYPQKTGPTQ